MKCENKVLKLDELCEKFNEKCSGKAVYNDLVKKSNKISGWIWKHISEFLTAIYLSLSIVLFVLLSYFVDGEFTVKKILSRLSFSNINAYIFYLIFFALCAVIMIIVINIGKYFLGRKLLKENNKLNKDNYEKKFIFPRKTNKMIRDILDENKKEFLKNYLSGLKKEDLINLYQFCQNRKNEIEHEISNNSNMKVVIPFTTITVTLVLSQIADAFNVKKFIFNKNGETAFWLSILMLSMVGYILFRLVVFGFEKIEGKLNLYILMRQKKKMNNFLYYLEEVILNYNIYYNLKKIENTDENSKNHSKIKIKLFNKIILHINKVG